MGQQPNGAPFECGNDVWSPRYVSDLILQSRSTLHAIDLLADHIQTIGLKLLFLGAYDPAGKKDCTVVYSGFPKYLEQMCTEFEGNKGCPLVQMAMKSREPFDALSLYLAGFDEFFSMRYLKELRNLGFAKVDVLPIEICNSVFIFFVGIAPQKRNGGLTRKLSEFLSQFTVGLSIKFNLDKISQKRLRKSHKAMSKVDLSAHEAQCLDWLATGKTMSDIASKLRLSEHTVACIVNSACYKLQARSRCNAIATATSVGFVDHRGT